MTPVRCRMGDGQEHVIGHIPKDTDAAATLLNLAALFEAAAVELAIRATTVARPVATQVSEEKL